MNQRQMISRYKSNPFVTRRCKTSIAAALLAVIAACAFAQVVWQPPIRHETITFYDASRDNRPVAVEIVVRRDKEIQANAGLIKLPVAVLNHGNTVKFTQYSFLANVFAARGFMAISIQHDQPTDPPMVTKVGELYVGRQPQYLRGVANIKFAVVAWRRKTSSPRCACWRGRLPAAHERRCAHRCRGRRHRHGAHLVGARLLYLGQAYWRSYGIHANAVGTCTSLTR
jgi:hypothetical protein